MLRVALSISLIVVPDPTTSVGCRGRTLTLTEANRGDTIQVIRIPEGLVRAQLLRLGIWEGSKLTCALKVPAGPMVVRQDDIEIALGRNIASEIQVSPCHA